MLRKFFARSDDISNGFAYIAPSHTGSSAGGILSDGVPTLRNQDSQAHGSHFHHSSGSHSQQSFQPVAVHSDAHRQLPFMVGAAPKAYTPYSGSSTREDRPNHGEERLWQNTLQTESSTNVRSSLTESSLNANQFEEGEPDEGELYRCRDCNLIYPFESTLLLLDPLFVKIFRILEMTDLWQVIGSARAKRAI
ncbi:hypothetical protein PGT21_028708 [Puccinia graminis f. sp. tritici]|uniref:Uncharacterized protein n=1 Tax=Puccinia graminis f. sp. tritici TaxID=56615 RepID=A0A5B0PL89_PUCGR|nr:hypothetical protein PGT21_028708 [Puccinia graminis f. sp. tritici]